MLKNATEKDKILAHIRSISCFCCANWVGLITKCLNKQIKYYGIKEIREENGNVNHITEIVQILLSNIFVLVLILLLKEKSPPTPENPIFKVKIIKKYFLA